MSVVVPIETKRFERWLNQQDCWASWPIDMVQLAYRGVMAHQAIYDERFENDRQNDPLFLERAKADLAAFLAGYSEMRDQQRTKST